MSGFSGRVFDVLSCSQFEGELSMTSEALSDPNGTPVIKSSSRVFTQDRCVSVERKQREPLEVRLPKRDETPIAETRKT